MVRAIFDASSSTDIDVSVTCTALESGFQIPSSVIFDKTCSDIMFVTGYVANDDTKAHSSSSGKKVAKTKRTRKCLLFSIATPLISIMVIIIILCCVFLISRSSGPGGDDIVVCEAPSMPSALKRKDFENLKQCNAIEILGTTNKISKDALSQISNLYAVAVDQESRSRPEDCDFLSGEVAGDTGYKHVHVLRIDPSSTTNVTVPDYEVFAKGSQIPIIQRAEAKGEILTVGSEKYKSSAAGLNFYFVSADTDKLQIYGGDSYSEENGYTLDVVEWNDSEANWGADPNADIGTVDLVVPYGVYKIAAGQYRNNTALRSVTIPPTTKVIGESGFRYCSSLERVILSGGVRSIGVQAFSLTKLTSITIPGSVDVISNNAFESAPSLSSLSLMEGIYEIGGLAFSSAKLSSIVIPESITSLGENPFCLCQYLQEVSSKGQKFVLNDNNHELVDKDEGRLVTLIAGYKDPITVYVVSTNITVIGDSAARENQSISVVELHSQVREIGPHAFYYSKGLFKMTMKVGLISFGYAAINLTAIDGNGGSTGMSRPLRNIPNGEGDVGVIDICMKATKGGECERFKEADTLFGNSSWAMVTCSFSCPEQAL